MTRDALYRRLAAGGNKDAQAILDAGPVPDAEVDGDTSEQQELTELRGLQAQVNEIVASAEERAADEDDDEEAGADDLAEFAQKVGALKAQGDIMAAAGDNKGAGDVHMNRGYEFDWRDQHAEAASAFRDAATCYRKHADEACAQLTPEQVKAWHAQKKTADGEGCVCGCRNCECGCERGGTCVCSSNCPYAQGAGK